MLIDTNLGKHLNGYRQFALNPRLQKLIAMRSCRYVARDAAEEELRVIAEEIRQSLPIIAHQTVLSQLQRHNPAIFQIVRETSSGRMVGVSAQLPLTEEGINALIEGHFDARSPDMSYVAKPGQTARAVYLWLTYSPKSLIVTLAGLAEYLHRICPEGDGLFCRPVDGTAEKFLRELGFCSAKSTFPRAHSDLLYSPRSSDGAQHEKPFPATEVKSSPVIDVKIARDLQDIARVMAVRAATYMYEQECPFDEEFDGNDFSATHLLGMIDCEPAGCIRIRYFGEFVKFERLAVRHEFRSSKLAFRLVRQAMRFAAQKGFRKAYGHARRDIVKFWETFGFRPIPGRPVFSFSDVEYVEMEGPIRAPVETVTAAVDPLRIIRPEGQWDIPGVLERPSNLSRRARIQSAMRS